MDKIHINRAHTTDVKELSINDTTVTATAAELNAVDGSAISMTTSATESSGSSAVQLVFYDAAGVIMAVPTSGLLYISNVDTGLTHDLTTGVAVLTYGALSNLIAHGTSHYTTDAAGKLGITISFGSADSFWVVVILPSGKLLISDECTVGA